MSTRQKGNRFERLVMGQLLAADGPCRILGKLATAAGRIGHLESLGLDGATRRLGVECKHRESYPDWIFDLVEQTDDRAAVYDKLGVVALKKNRRDPIVALKLSALLKLIDPESNV